MRQQTAARVTDFKFNAYRISYFETIKKKWKETKA